MFYFENFKNPLCYSGLKISFSFCGWKISVTARNQVVFISAIAQILIRTLRNENRGRYGKNSEIGQRNCLGVLLMETYKCYIFLEKERFSIP